MASQDEVNRQHMAAMGLDPDTLGKPAVDPQDDRCEEKHPDQPWYRCRGARGHRGPHQREGLVWSNDREQAFKKEVLGEFTDTQCTSDNPYGRCERPAGHTGHHARGGFAWGDLYVENGRLRDSMADDDPPITNLLSPTIELLSPTKTRPGDQPLPVINDHPDIQSMVIADIEARRLVGISRYGTALQPNNGRDMLLDAYEEAMDLAIYLKGAIVERDLRAAGELQTREADEPVQPDFTTWRELGDGADYMRIFRSWYSIAWTNPEGPPVEDVRISDIHIKRTHGPSRPPSLAFVGAWGQPGTKYYEEILAP